MTTPGKQQRPGWGTQGDAGKSFDGDTHSVAVAYVSAQHWGAVGYARRGWPVIPLQGKVPWTRHGLRDQSTDLETIDRWWWQWPTANVGIALPNHVVVLDVDPRHGGDATLDQHTRRHGPLPDTLTAVTGRGDGGCHFFFLHPGGPLSDRRLGDGLDLRIGGRHYVVGPPSVHPESLRPYAWGNRNRIAAMPAWLVDMARPHVAAVPARPQGAGDRGAGLVRHVAGLQQGNRNHGLHWAACRAAEDGLLAELTEALVTAAVGIGLPEQEARRTIASAGRAVTR